MCARICLAPSAQFNPTDSGAACVIEFQNASGVCPESSRPGAVGDGAGNHHRQADAAGRHDFGEGEDRGLGVERVEDRLDQQHIDTAVDQSAHLLAISGAQFDRR